MQLNIDNERDNHQSDRTIRRHRGTGETAKHIAIIGRLHRCIRIGYLLLYYCIKYLQLSNIMFDVSWAEVFFIGAFSVTIIGRKDMPKATRFLGTQRSRS